MNMNQHILSQDERASLIFYELDGEYFGGYDTLLHAPEYVARKIMAFFGQRELLPDFMPRDPERNESFDRYLFFVDSVNKIIAPMWSYNYAYGGLYNAYGPVGDEKDIPSFDIIEYSYRHYCAVEIERETNEETPLSQWRDWEFSVFTRRRMKEEKEYYEFLNNPNNPNFNNKRS